MYYELFQCIPLIAICLHKYLNKKRDNSLTESKLKVSKGYNRSYWSDYKMDCLFGMKIFLYLFYITRLQFLVDLYQ